MNKIKALSEDLLSVLHVLIYALITVIISGTQPAQKFQKCTFADFRIVSFELFSPAFVRAFSVRINTYRATASIIITAFCYKLSGVLLFAAFSDCFALINTLGVAAFQNPGALYLLKSDFTETQF